MSRLVLERGEQRKFLRSIYEHGLSWLEVAKICNVCERTLRDWIKEKFKIKFEAVQALNMVTHVPIPRAKIVLPENWNVKNAGKRGGFIRCRKHGNPGTQEGRRRGGIKSQKKFHSDLLYAKSIGVKIRKEIVRPANSELLAEFIGIMLGDGGITNNQVRITFNGDTDITYSKFIQQTIRKLFGVNSTIIKKRSDKGNDIVISSRNLVDFLTHKGLRIGSKIRNQADVPPWVLKKRGFRVSCLRGLVDTDGSFYLYEHKVSNKRYLNFAMCFTNNSSALLSSMYEISVSLGFSPVKNNNRVYLHKKVDIVKYFDIIKTHNSKHLLKYNKFRYLKKS